MHDDVDVTVSKSLTDLADLPLPVPKQKKTAVVQGWNDDGFEDDWDFGDAEEKPKPTA